MVMDRNSENSYVCCLGVKCNSHKSSWVASPYGAFKYGSLPLLYCQREFGNVRNRIFHDYLHHIGVVNSKREVFDALKGVYTTTVLATK